MEQPYINPNFKSKELRMVQCRICERLFTVPKGNGHSNTRYCGDECRKTAKRQSIKHSSRRFRERKRSGKSNITRCKICGKFFNRKGTSRVTCSDLHRILLKRKKNREWKKRYRRHFSSLNYRHNSALGDTSIIKVNGVERVKSAVLLEKLKKKMNNKIVV